MKHRLLLSRLFNTPLALSEESLAGIVSTVGGRLLQGLPLTADEQGVFPQAACKKGRRVKGEEDMPEQPFLPMGEEEEVDPPGSLPPNWAMIPIYGTLSSKNAAGACCVETYADITEDIRECLAEGYTTLVFDVDSPGGEVAGNFALASFIASLPSQYGVRTLAFVDGYACSAAYVIASACQTVVATPSSFLGSIGVIATLVDLTEADKLEGEAYTVIRSKADKAKYNPHEKLSAGVVKEVRADLEALDGLMNQLISKHRPKLTEADLLEFNGATFIAEEALAKGLVDRLTESFDQFLIQEQEQEQEQTQALAQPSSPRSSQTLPPKHISTVGVHTMNLEEATARIAALEAQQASAVTTERNRTAAIIEAGKTTGMSAALVESHIKAGTTAEVAAAIFLGIKEGIDASISSRLQGMGDASSLSTSTAPKPAGAEGAQDKPLAGGVLSMQDLLTALAGEKHA